MKRNLILLFLCIVFPILPATGCINPVAGGVAFDQLMANPIKYNGKDITVEAFYFHGFETIVLAGNLKQSGHAAGHLIPEGNMVWVEGGIPSEVYNQLHRQQIMGPLERYGKVRMRGKFSSGGRYGHLGSYKYQITPSEVQLLPWSPK
jgi:hypothetical protein